MILLGKLLKQFNHLSCFEFSKYGCCFKVINQLESYPEITVFEVSPTPSGGVLILVSSNSATLEILYQQQLDHLKSTIIYSCLIKNVYPQILTAYASQNESIDFNNLCFYESNSICEAFLMAQRILLSKASIIDFRVIRSVHNRSILIFTGVVQNFEGICITKVNSHVIEYFQISK